MDKNTQPQAENDTLPQFFTDDKIRIFANLLIDRILESQLKTDINKGE